MKKGKNNKKLYMGVDVGGTKILAALVKQSGAVAARKRRPTPRDVSPEAVLLAIMEVMDELLAEEEIDKKSLRAVGMAVPGVVDPEEGKIVVTPNMNLSGLEAVSHIRERFDAPVVLGNDVNFGTQGERWLGAARFASSAVGIFVGTGIGGGIIEDGRLVRGSREAAGEIGHIVMSIDGPVCGCGNRGCLEALASRSAIEREIRQAIAKGRKSILTRIAGKDLEIIRSRMLNQALQQGDKLVTEVVRGAAQMLGYACLTVRRLLDPEVIVLGGGVIEACGDFMMPIIEQVVSTDALPGARGGGRIVRSVLGDDAVVLGAVAAAQEHIGRQPMQVAAKSLPKYPKIDATKLGEVVIDGRTYRQDVYIRADGRIKARNKTGVQKRYGTSHEIGPEEVKKICKKNPEILIIGTGQKGMAGFTAEGQEMLRRKGIACLSLPTPQAIREYNRIKGRKAMLIHVTR
ncbi:MAG: ROK family protein [Planctomycetes bacterium]|nr:ROK family protein [Planctomycetota bacterium]